MGEGEKRLFRCCSAGTTTEHLSKRKLNGEKRLARFSKFTTVKELRISALLCVRREARLARRRITDTARKSTG